MREHLATCQECAAAHAELAGIPGLLDLAVVTGATDEEPLPPAIEERLLDRFARERVERPPRRRWRPRIALGVGSALAGAAIAVAALIVRLELPAERRPARVAVPARLRARRRRAGQRQRARRAADARRPAPSCACGSTTFPTGDVYEVFCDAPGWSASAGTFRVDAKGDAYVILTTAVKKGQYDKIRLVRREHLASGKVETYGHPRRQAVLNLGRRGAYPLL